MSKSASTATAIPKVTSVVTSATTLTAVSCAFGISRTIAMPTMGMNTISVSAQLSNQFIGANPLESVVGEQQRQGQQAHRAEHQQCVPLDTSRLEVAQEAPALPSDLGHAVDGAVDALLVERVVGEVPADAGAPSGAVDHCVDDVLVDPVRTSGDRAADAGDDHVLVQDVEVVLVLEEGVSRV